MPFARIARPAAEPVVGALFIAWWIVAEAARLPNIPAIVAVVHPVTTTDWPMYLTALAVPALVVADGTRRTLRPSLVADGMSNAQIATALFVSEPTVKSHLRSILSKFNLRSRTEVVAFAWRTGLVRSDTRQPG